MSLGWSTESALLPGKVKNIKVTSASMHGLKAQLARPSKRRPVDEFASKKKPKKKKVEEEEVDVFAKLAAKARVYDELASGAKTADASEVLVDFGSAPKEVEARDEDTGWAWSTGHERAPATAVAMVRSQWEKTLSDQQKGLLDDIADDTTRGRAKARDKATDRDRRRGELAARLGAPQNDNMEKGAL